LREKGQTKRSSVILRRIRQQIGQNGFLQKVADKATDNSRESDDNRTTRLLPGASDPDEPDKVALQLLKR
jgi:hypothetical protein